MMSTMLNMLGHAEVPVAVSELVLLVVAVSLCCLFRLHRMGLMISYLFCVHLAWLVCNEEILVKIPNAFPYVVAYFASAGLILVLSAIGMLRASD